MEVQYGGKIYKYTDLCSRDCPTCNCKLVTPLQYLQARSMQSTGNPLFTLISLSFTSFSFSDFSVFAFLVFLCCSPSFLFSLLFLCFLSFLSVIPPPSCPPLRFPGFSSSSNFPFYFLLLRFLQYPSFIPVSPIRFPSSRGVLSSHPLSLSLAPTCHLSCTLSLFCLRCTMGRHGTSSRTSRVHPFVTP